MTYPNGGTTPTTVFVDAVGNAAHRVAAPLASTGINWLPLVVMAGIVLTVGVALTVLARVLRRPIDFDFEDRH